MVFIAKSPENLVLVIAFLLLKFFKFRCFFFFKRLPVFVKKVFFFDFFKCVGGFGYSSP